MDIKKRREIWDKIEADDYLDAIFRGSLEIEADWTLTVWHVDEFLTHFPSRAAFRPVRQEFLAWAKSEDVEGEWQEKLDLLEEIFYAKK